MLTVTGQFRDSPASRSPNRWYSRSTKKQVFAHFPPGPLGTGPVLNPPDFPPRFMFKTADGEAAQGNREGRRVVRPPARRRRAVGGFGAGPQGWQAHAAAEETGAFPATVKLIG